jgi:hypothetical protein
MAQAFAIRCALHHDSPSSTKCSLHHADARKLFEPTSRRDLVRFPDNCAHVGAPSDREVVPSELTIMSGGRDDPSLWTVFRGLC